MKKVMVLGAGLCSGPLVQHLLARDDVLVTVADMDANRAFELVDDCPRGTAVSVDMRDQAAADELLDAADLCVSFLPPEFQVDVARLALAHGTHLVTPCYETDEVRALGDAALQAGLTFLNEMGLDPGIDHMVAMRLIHGISRHGGSVTAYASLCGGIPAPEARTNPWDYKFSWNPRGTVLGARKDARYVEGGREVALPGNALFSRHWLIEIPGFDELEAHFNGDSTVFAETYGLRGVDNFYRATLRYPGWSFAMEKLGILGYLGVEEFAAPLPTTYAELTRRLGGIPERTDLRTGLAALLSVDVESDPMRRMEWLGLLGSDPVVWGDGSTPLDALANLMLSKMPFCEGERDLCVLHNIVEAEYPSGRHERITSTLMAYGEPEGELAMARTVGLPAAIAALLILDGRINDRGVVRPVLPSIYEPILYELSKAGIVISESAQVQ